MLVAMSSAAVFELTRQAQRQLRRRFSAIDDSPGEREVDELFGVQRPDAEAILVHRSDEDADQRLARLVIGAPLGLRLLEHAVAPCTSGVLGHGTTVGPKRRTLQPNFVRLAGSGRTFDR